ncbi:aspartate--tRNA(Asn) ligase [Candidatus Wolfebacteria bacterium]|nr:aspartate--tRNA(Asn) ligase [Candidatus Wolfebacteria bacterium]
MRTPIKYIINKENEKVEIAGWVDVRRDHGKLIFIDLRDRSGLVQVVFLPSNKEVAQLAKELRLQWAIKISGIVSRRPKGMINQEVETGEFEVAAESLKILSKADEIPFDFNSQISLETFLDWQPFVLRSQKNRNIFKIQSEIIRAFGDFLKSLDFTEIQVPKIVAQATEGGANVFKIDYFDSKAYLAQSPQFYKQIMVGVFERVFTIGNAYRAEEHSTTRHLNEYTSLDLEFGFIDDHRDIMNLERDLLDYVMEHLKKNCIKELNFFNLEIPKVPKKIPDIKLREAQKILKNKYDIDCKNEPDLDPAHERQICEYAKSEFDSDFIFITHYPIEKRPFYTYPDEDDPGYTKSFDLLFRGMEITTGGQRINNYFDLADNIKKWKMNPENFSFYLQAFKYGMPPEGGLAIGLERLTQKILNIENVREATLFPRDMNRIDVLLSTLKK